MIKINCSHFARKLVLHLGNSQLILHEFLSLLKAIDEQRFLNPVMMFYFHSHHFSMNHIPTRRLHNSPYFHVVSKYLKK